MSRFRCVVAKANGVPVRRRGAVAVAASRRPTTLEPVLKISAKLKRQQEALIALAEKFEPKIRDAFIRAVNAIQDEASMRKLADALARGRWEEVLRATGLDAFEVELGSMMDAINQNYAEAGAATARGAAEGLASYRIGFRFDPMNPRATEYARQYAFDLIQGIRRESTNAIRNIVVRATKDGTHPYATARQIKQVIGLTERQAQALANYRAALKAQKFSQAKSYSIGGNAEKVITAAAANTGKLTAEQIDNLTDQYRERLLRMRARTIARTESMRAVSNGANEAWQQAADSTNVPKSAFRRYWVSTADDRTRDTHREMPVLNADGVGMNEPFRLPGGGSILYPHDPNAPASETINCRCCVVVRIEELPANVPLFGVAAGRSILPR